MLCTLMAAAWATGIRLAENTRTRCSPARNQSRFSVPLFVICTCSHERSGSPGIIHLG